MRIRQVKPDLWTDPVTARFSDGAIRLYIGLWNVADDGGYLAWDIELIGALLYSYDTPRNRVRRINKAAAEIVESGRMAVLECGHAHIPTLPHHQRLSGSTKRVLTEQKKHEARQCPHIPADARTSPRIPDTEIGIGTVGNGKVRNVIAGAREQEPRDPRERELQCIDGQWVHVA